MQETCKQETWKLGDVEISGSADECYEIIQAWETVTGKKAIFLLGSYKRFSEITPDGLYNSYRDAMIERDQALFADHPEKDYLTWEEIKAIPTQHYKNVVFLFRAITDHINKTTRLIHESHSNKKWDEPIIEAECNRFGVVAIKVTYKVFRSMNSVEINFDLDSQVIGMIIAADNKIKECETVFEKLAKAS
jgi:hypothetical protein